MPAKKSERNKKVPKLRHHLASGQGYVKLNDKAIYLGPYGEPETLEHYHRVIAEWVAAGRQLPAEPDQIKVKEVIARFWVHAQGYYVRRDGSQTNEVKNIRQALRPIKELYGETAAAEFGTTALKTVRQKMIDLGWCRSNINKMVARLKRMFRWAAEENLIPSSVFHDLQTVKGLPQGRSEAYETEPVKPVPQEHIDAVKPYVSRQVWSMIELQLLTGARSGEIVTMRPCEVDTSKDIWIYTPGHHKTAHRGHKRTIYIGPRGQEVLRPFLLRSPDSYCFSPAEARAEWQEEKRLNRTTPKSTGNRAGTNIKINPKRKPGQHYIVTSYGQAIRKAIKYAYRPAGMSNTEFKKWKAPQHWFPHQLRHCAATYLRKEFGLEVARIILGHSSPVVTEIYAERDMEKAIETIRKIG